MIDLTSNTQKNKNSSTTPLSSLDILQNHNMTSWTEDILKVLFVKTSVALKVFFLFLAVAARNLPMFSFNFCNLGVRVRS